MPLLVNADFDRQLRIWFYRLVSATSVGPTGKSILSLLVSSVDRLILLDNDLMNDLMRQAIDLAARHDRCSPDDVVDALCKITDGTPIPKGRRATRATHILEALVARMVYGKSAEDRVRIDPNVPQVLDFLHDWFQCVVQQVEQPGGAPAIIAQRLAQLGEPNVVLWVPYLSEKQAAVFDPQVRFLNLAQDCKYAAQSIQTAGRPDDPEIRNYSLEFSKGASFEFKRPDGSSCSAVASASDRVIAISPGYLFFDALSSHVDVTKSLAAPPRVDHLLSRDPQLGPSCAAQVAQDYKWWFVGGLHSVSQPCQPTLEADLRQVPPDVTLHVEIAGPDISLWFQHVLRQCVNSIGVNVDDIRKLAERIVANGTPHAQPPLFSGLSDLENEYFLRLAFWLACELDLERVYVHGLKLDYVVRREASDAEMHQEVVADLLAKTVVMNSFRGASVRARPYSTESIPRNNLESFIDLCEQRAYPTQPVAPTLESLENFTRSVLDRGWFSDVFVYDGKEIKFRVAIIPVALFRLYPPGGLKIVGAGDTTSAVSFVFGCFTTRGSKRRQ